MVIRELLTKWGFEVDDGPLRQAEQSMQKVQKLGLQVTGVLLGVAGAVGVLANAYSEHEKTVIAFETLMGSAEEADKILKELAGFAAKTPFDLIGVQQNAKQLMAVGIESEKVIDTMKALGDVSAGVNVPLSRIAVNYGQVKTTGVAMTRELKDFAFAGIPIFDELAKVTGKNVNQVQEMASKSQITFDMVEQAFINMTSEGGKFYNLMFRQSEALGGKISNLGDIFDGFKIKIGEFASGPLKKALDGILGFLEAHEDEIVAELGKSVENLTNWLIKLASAFWSVAQIVWPVIQALGGLDGIIITLTTSMMALMAVFGAIALFNVIKQIKMMYMAVMALDKALLALMGKILFWVGLIALVALAFEDLYRFIRGEGSLIGDILGSMFDAGTVDMIRQNILLVWEVFKGFFEGLSQGFTEAFALILPLFAGMGSSWSEIFQNMRDIVVSVFNVISPILQGFFETAMKRMKMFTTFIGRLAGWILGGISMVVSGVIGGIAKAIEFLTKKLTGLGAKIKQVPLIGRFFDTGNDGQNNLNSANAGYMSDDNFMNSLAMAGTGNIGMAKDASGKSLSTNVTNTVGEVVVNVPASAGTPEEVGVAVKDSMAEFFTEKMNMANADLQPTREN